MGSPRATGRSTALATGRLLLIAGDSAARQLGAEAESAGCQALCTDSGFDAIDAAVCDAGIEAVLLEYERFQPRSSALARALRSARPNVPVYLLAPPFLEPEVKGATANLPGVTYLVIPLDRDDWQAISRSITPRPQEPPATSESTPADGAAAAAELPATAEKAPPGEAPPAARVADLVDVGRQMACIDALSGAFNRRYLMAFLEQLIARARREHFRITLLMFGVDDFKRYNDARGHKAGDEIIVETTRLMRQCSRPHDVIARIGGDEFAVLFWDAGPPRQPGNRHPQEAKAMADRFRRALAGRHFHSLGPEAGGTLTISGGLASFPGDATTAEGLLAVAGEGLIAAKRSGKDRIYLVGQEPT